MVPNQNSRMTPTGYLPSDIFMTGKAVMEELESYLKLSGGTVSGPITLAADPTNLMHAATKSYVDAEVQTAKDYADTLTGVLSDVLFIRAYTGLTTNATPTDITGGVDAILLVDGDTVVFSARIAARRLDAPGESTGFIIEGVAQRTGAVSAIVGITSKMILTPTRWDCDVEVDDATDALKLVATGATGKLVKWSVGWHVVRLRV